MTMTTFVHSNVERLQLPNDLKAVLKQPMDYFTLSTQRQQHLDFEKHAEMILTSDVSWVLYITVLTHCCRTSTTTQLICPWPKFSRHILWTTEKYIPHWLMKLRVNEM